MPYSRRQKTVAWKTEFRFKGWGVNLVNGGGKSLPSWGNSWYENPVLGGLPAIWGTEADEGKDAGGEARDVPFEWCHYIVLLHQGC